MTKTCDGRTKLVSSNRSSLRRGKQVNRCVGNGSPKPGVAAFGSPNLRHQPKEKQSSSAANCFAYLSSALLLDSLSRHLWPNGEEDRGFKAVGRFIVVIECILTLPVWSSDGMVRSHLTPLSCGSNLDLTPSRISQISVSSELRGESEKGIKEPREILGNKATSI